MELQNNPLSKHFRQPSIYITLPSGGKYSPQGTIEFDSGQELAVYPMTARDDMTMATPDALMNGQATVDVIKSCVPGIKDPWQLPMMDLDTVMIAIRIASQGEMLDMEVNVPSVNQKMSFSTDLRVALDSIDRSQFNEYVQLESQLSVRVRPTNYRQLTNLSLRTFEEQRMIAQLGQKDDMTPQQKSDHYARIFTNMTDLTIENMLNAIVSVNSEGTEVSDPQLIKDFVNNLDSKQAKKIRQHIENQNNIGKIKPFKVMPSKELISKGAPESFEVPIAMDNSNFFVSQF